MTYLIFAVHLSLSSPTPLTQANMGISVCLSFAITLPSSEDFVIVVFIYIFRIFMTCFKLQMVDSADSIVE